MTRTLRTLFLAASFLAPLAAGADTIVDNSDAAFQSYGTWTPSKAIAGYQGSDYLVHAPGVDYPGAMLLDDAGLAFTTVGDWANSTAVAGYIGSGYRTHPANGPSPDAIVVDDSVAAVAGTWKTSTSVSGYLGAGYLAAAAGSGGNTVVWTPDLPRAATYHVLARWTAHANRASNATYTVTSDQGQTQVSVDQRQNGGQWNDLGSFAFTPGQGQGVTLTDQADGYVIADALQFLPTDARPNQAVWSIEPPQAGSYLLQAHWTAHANRASNATYRVTSDQGQSQISVDQRQNGGQWNDLGSFAFSPGRNENVTLTDQADGYVIADALRLIPENAQPDHAQWQMPTGTYDVAVRWSAYPNRASDATYVVHHRDGDTRLSFDQRQNGGAWVPLGRFTFTDSARSIDLESSETGYAIADAIQLAGAVPPPYSGYLYLHPDQLGSVREITDEAGQIVWNKPIADEPFGAGAPREDPDGDGRGLSFDLRFPGQIHDTETGLSYNYYRDYDPATGRYVESDPIGLAGGMNLYGYVEGSPVGFVDPLGLASYGYGPLDPYVGHGNGGGNGSSMPAAGVVPLAVCFGPVCGIVPAPVPMQSQWPQRAPVPTPIQPQKPDCENCATKYPEYISCSSLGGYMYGNKQQALTALGGGSLHNPDPAYGGPCAGTKGAGMHWNVRVKGQRVGSIVSCTCCQDSPSGPSLQTRYKAVP